MNGSLPKKITPRLERFLRLAAVYGVLPALCFLLCVLLICFQITDGTFLRLGEELSLGEEVRILSLALNVSAAGEKSDAENEPMFDTGDLEATSGIAYVGSLPEGVFPILEVNITNSAGIINAMENSINGEELSAAAYPYQASSESGPIVLVLHTHATESYYEPQNLFSGYAAGQPDNVFGYYQFDSDTRSYDITKSVVAVGQVFTDKLNELGIPAVHCETLHDAENFSEAYNRSLESIQSYLAQYPSIRYIIDLHRDSLLRSNGEKLKPTTVINGEKVAQVMLVIGCGGTSAAQPHWRDNLALNYKWQASLIGIGDTFARPMYLRYGRFNQHVSVGTMLIEVGSCGNTLEEAKRAGSYAAQALAKTIQNGEGRASTSGG